jgi:hypothetical protein
MPKILETLKNWFAERFSPISVRIADESGWSSLSSQPNDRPLHEIQELYRSALEATRKNPMAKAIVDITTDFVLGDGILLSSPVSSYRDFIDRFWNHPLNRVDQRLQSMSDELSRAGDLFVALFLNEQDGMSYMRFVTKEEIVEIETAENDWETEIAYHQRIDSAGETKVWLSPSHPEARESEVIMLHYAVNRPIGAGYGEGDLDTVIPWLLRYSRMLEDRVRLNWAIRSFLWFVTVPTHLVEAKQSQYARPPEAGSIVVKDDGEDWEVKSPNLRAADARHDLQAVRHMIDAVGYPPHWRGEPGDANLATANAMQLRPERHLRRRQNHLVFVLQDLIYHSYKRAHAAGKTRAKPSNVPYDELYTVRTTDISRSDNEALARSARDLTGAFSQVFDIVETGGSPTLTRRVLELVFKFAGEPLSDNSLDGIMKEAARSNKNAEGEEPSNNGHDLGQICEFTSSGTGG